MAGNDLDLTMQDKTWRTLQVEVYQKFKEVADLCQKIIWGKHTCVTNLEDQTCTVEGHEDIPKDDTHYRRHFSQVQSNMHCYQAELQEHPNHMQSTNSFAFIKIEARCIKEIDKAIIGLTKFIDFVNDYLNRFTGQFDPALPSDAEEKRQKLIEVLGNAKTAAKKLVDNSLVQDKKIAEDERQAMQHWADDRTAELQARTRLKGLIYLAVYGFKPNPRNELPTGPNQKVNCYLGWMKTHVTSRSLKLLSWFDMPLRFRHLRHGSQGVQRAEELLQFLYNPEIKDCTKIQEKCMDTMALSGNNRHSLRRYLYVVLSIYREQNSETNLSSRLEEINKLSDRDFETQWIEMQKSPPVSPQGAPVKTSLEPDLSQYLSHGS